MWLRACRDAQTERVLALPVFDAPPCLLEIAVEPIVESVGVVGLGVWLVVVRVIVVLLLVLLLVEVVLVVVVFVGVGRSVGSAGLLVVAHYKSKPGRFMLNALGPVTVVPAYGNADKEHR